MHAGLSSSTLAAALALWAATATGCSEPASQTASGSPPPPPVTPRSSSDTLGAAWSNFDDALLELRLELALLEEIGVPALGVELAVSGGEVRLFGRVPNSLSAAFVEDVAGSTAGVLAVVSDLQVVADPAVAVGSLAKAEQRLADALLATRVRAALVRELGRTAFDVVVEAADSHLILRGTLSDRRKLERTLAAAASVRGAEQVHDLLTLDG